MHKQQQCQTCKGSNAGHLYRVAGGRLHLPPAHDTQAAGGRRQGSPPDTRLLLRCSSAQLGGEGLRRKRNKKCLAFSCINGINESLGNTEHIISRVSGEKTIKFLFFQYGRLAVT